MTTHNNTCTNIVEESKCDVQYTNKNELQYVLFARDAFDRKLFPNDFDNWTVHEQSTWITANMTTFFPNVPQSLVTFVPAIFHELNHDRSLTEKPKWLDVNKYRRGKKFVNDHYGSAVIALILGLVHMYSFEDVMKPLIVSKRTITPYLGFKRYLSTIQRMLRWYNGEPWIEGTPAYIDMQYIRKMHLSMRKRLCELTNEQIDNIATIAEPWCPAREILLKDFAAACSFQKIKQNFYTSLYESSYRPKGINNADMAGIQCCLVSFFLLYPQHIGLHYATDEDFEAYCHMWRCYGYFLGIEDEYNFCRGSLEEIKQRVRDLYEYLLLPNFKDTSPAWEHMTRCLGETMNYFPLVYLPYKALILMTTDALNFKMPILHASLSYTEWIAYKSWTFLLRQALKFSPIRYVFNNILCKIINTATNFGPEKLAQLQEKSNKMLQTRT